ncbi:fungal-specific transcription factor domain-containing protein [Trametes polyzona]|nr:fungal-specific transcription factor domain-containing protein [Trametes polyzona]
MDADQKTASTQPRSDDEAAPASGPSTSTQGKIQRSAKACDKCRKAKSKCEPSPKEGEPCKTCATIGAECTYTAPSFRRGPPKGYIQALEHRLHQVESVLAAIMSSSDVRSKSIVNELSKDELAGYILDTVDAGPFGKTGREKRAIDTTKDNFFSSIVSEKPKAQSHRSRRESRATRENVIENVIARDPMIQTTRPTLLWQDRLSERLARSFGEGSTSPPPVPSGSQRAESHTSEPPRTKRRLEEPPPNSVQLTTPYLHTARSLSSAATTEVSSEDNLDDCADAFGNLSIDENREVRYHGNSCGLQLLAHAERTDGRNLKGIWNFPMAKLWHKAGDGSGLFIDNPDARLEYRVRLPPPHIQDRLVQVYFTYVNPAIPVVDEESFMSQFNSMKLGYTDSGRPSRPPSVVSGEVQPERPQTLSKLLLFAIFAYSASYLDNLPNAWKPQDKAAAGRADDYATCARRILDTMYHESRSSTVQALILLGMREFGIGSLEEGWLHIGMAVRMALDLGLNRNPEKWTHNGRELFTAKEKEIRKRIWWACCLADKFSALFLGRTIAIHEGDSSTPLLEVPPDDADIMWQPSPIDPRYSTITPVPAVYFGYFHHMSSLYIILGEVFANIYRVSRAQTVPPRALRSQLYSRLLQWALELPEHLKYNPAASGRPCPAPHVLVMHIQYWVTVLLVHRPFIPKGADLARAGSPSLDPDPVPWESYDICQSAASQIASFAMAYHEKYDMRWAPPLVATCIQAAGIMHVITLKYKPLDAQASIGLQKCISALTGMEATWATATRVRDLIKNAKVNIDSAYSSLAGASVDQRQKRPVQVAFAFDHTYDARSQSSTPPTPLRASASQQHQPAPARSMQPQTQAPAQYSRGGSYIPSTHSQPPQRFVSSAPATTPDLTGYMPGYDSWWPMLDGSEHLPGISTGPSAAGLTTSTSQPTLPQHPVRIGVAHLGPTGANPSPSASASGALPVGGGVPQGEFTFGQQHFSPEFLQAMRDPMLHFPSAFGRMY